MSGLQARLLDQAERGYCFAARSQLVPRMIKESKKGSKECIENMCLLIVVLGIVQYFTNRMVSRTMGTRIGLASHENPERAV